MTSFCILNEKRKGVSGSAFFNKPATGTKNLKFNAIKSCDFKMDLIKWQLN